MRSLAVIVFLACLTGAPAPVAAQEGGTVLTPKQRERERKAMSAYAATRYQEALDLYADLYADFHDPLYLRNIGRCHQKLKHPDEAIASFEEYLSKYKRLGAAESDEVQGWIHEMKELQKAATPPPPVVQAPVTTPVPPPPVVVTPAPPPVQLVQQATPPARDDNVTTRRIGVGAVILGAALAVTGGVFAATSWSKYNASRNGACLTSTEGCSKAADAIDQRALLSKIFLAGGAAAGLTGGALIVFFPVTDTRSTALTGAGASAAWSF